MYNSSLTRKAEQNVIASFLSPSPAVIKEVQFLNFAASLVFITPINKIGCRGGDLPHPRCGSLSVHDRWVSLRDFIFARGSVGRGERRHRRKLHILNYLAIRRWRNLNCSCGIAVMWPCAIEVAAARLELALK